MSLKRSLTANKPTDCQQENKRTNEACGSYIPQQNKISYMQIRKNVFLAASGPDCQLRIAIFAVLFQSMSLARTPNQSIFQTVLKALAGNSNGHSDQAGSQTQSQLQNFLQLHYNEPEHILERTLMVLFNEHYEYDEILLSNAKLLMEKSGCRSPYTYEKFLMSIGKVCEGFVLSVESLEESHRQLSRTNLFLFQKRLMKLSVRGDSSDSQSQNSSAFSLPKNNQPSDTMELTLTKTPFHHKDSQAVVITEWTQPAQPERQQSFWSILCCSSD